MRLHSVAARIGSSALRRIEPNTLKLRTFCWQPDCTHQNCQLNRPKWGESSFIGVLFERSHRRHRSFAPPLQNLVSSTL